MVLIEIEGGVLLGQGEDAPLIPTPWPQDFVIGYGDKLHDAEFHGWEVRKYAHSVILSNFEYGAITWFDTFRIADMRCLVINRKSGQFKNQAPHRTCNSFQQNNNGKSKVCGKKATKVFRETTKQVKPSGTTCGVSAGAETMLKKM
jgi:hypothetical protein